MQSIREPDENIGGAIAQLGERLLCTQEVGGSIPPGSTNHLWHCDFVEDRGSFESSRTRSQLLTTKNYMNRVVQKRRDSTLFNNLEKVFDVLSGSTLCGYISKCRICTCRMTRSAFGRTGVQTSCEHKRNTVKLHVTQECFGLYGQANKRTWWMPRQ